MRKEIFNKIKDAFELEKNNQIKKHEDNKRIQIIQKVSPYDKEIDESKILNAIFLNHLSLIDPHETNDIYVYITEHLNEESKELEYYFANIEQKFILL